LLRREKLMDHNRIAELDALFASYRNAIEVPDATPDFMPGLWKRIDQRRSATYSFRRLASGFVTAAAALCLVMSLAMWSPQQSPAGTYVDVLTDDVGTALVDQGIQQGIPQ
jgi:hypothetical protein